MILGRVSGEVVATRKHPSHERRKILVVQPIHPDGSDRGEVILALDAVDAGVGDRVLVVQEGFAAMAAVNRPNSPIDMSIVGVIDSIEVHEEN
ncbi:MAG TPA: EutN/CcmL family microcompartment protein [Terriglobales bacterium]|nr:EutN/CcmL family microcompartment protein [Terriglobales bacterium]